jgi:hypothetical protein
MKLLDLLKKTITPGILTAITLDSNRRTIINDNLQAKINIKEEKIQKLQEKF